DGALVVPPRRRAQVGGGHPLGEKLGDGRVGADVLALAHLHQQGGQRVLSGPPAPLHGAPHLPPLPCLRVRPRLGAELPRALPPLPDVPAHGRIVGPPTLPWASVGRVTARSTSETPSDLGFRGSG